MSLCYLQVAEIFYFYKIILGYVCFPVNLLHIFRKPFYKNNFWGTASVFSSFLLFQVKYLGFNFHPLLLKCFLILFFFFCSTKCLRAKSRVSCSLTIQVTRFLFWKNASVRCYIYVVNFMFYIYASEIFH